METARKGPPARPDVASAVIRSYFRTPAPGPTSLVAVMIAALCLAPGGAGHSCHERLG